MRPGTFIASLFVASVGCVVIAAADRSFGWFLGAVVLFAVGLFALRLGAQEGVPGSRGARLGFVAISMLVMVAAIAGMAWLSMAG